MSNVHIYKGATRSLSPVTSMLQKNSLLAQTEVLHMIQGVDVTALVCPILYYVSIRVN